MKRRSYLSTLGSLSIGVVAGCLESDSDGEDEERNDSNTDSSSESTPPQVETHGDNLDQAAREKTIHVENSDWAIGNFSSYSYEHVELQLEADDLIAGVNELEIGESYTTSVMAIDFDDHNKELGFGKSEPFSFQPNQKYDLDVPLDWHGENIGNDLYLMGTVQPATELDTDGDFSSRFYGVFPAGATLVTASDPLSLTEYGLTVRESRHSKPTETIYGDEGYLRNNSEGAYHISFNLPSNPTPDGGEMLNRDAFYVPIETGETLPLSVPKLHYYNRKYEDRPTEPDPSHGYLEHPRDRTKYIEEGVESGIGEMLSNELYASAIQNGNSDAGEFLQYVVTFVQSLEYVTDLEGTDFQDYSRYPEETLVDAQGDCVDTTILLGTILGASGYDVAVLYAGEDGVEGGDPGVGHMALGVSTPGFDGLHREFEAVSPPIRDSGEEFYYIEGTGLASIGYVPPPFIYDAFEAESVSIPHGE